MRLAQTLADQIQQIGGKNSVRIDAVRDPLRDHRRNRGKQTSWRNDYHHPVSAVHYTGHIIGGAWGNQDRRHRSHGQYDDEIL